MSGCSVPFVLSVFDFFGDPRNGPGIQFFSFQTNRSLRPPRLAPMAALAKLQEESTLALTFVFQARVEKTSRSPVLGPKLVSSSVGQIQGGFG